MMQEYKTITGNISRRITSLASDRSDKLKEKNWGRYKLRNIGTQRYWGKQYKRNKTIVVFNLIGTFTIKKRQKRKKDAI